MPEFRWSFLGRICGGPGGDALRVIDYRAVVENERGHLVIAGETPHLAPIRKEPIGSEAPEGLDDFGPMPGGFKRLIGVATRIASRIREGAAADVEPHRRIVREFR